MVQSGSSVIVSYRVKGQYWILVGPWGRGILKVLSTLQNELIHTKVYWAPTNLHNPRNWLRNEEQERQNLCSHRAHVLVRCTVKVNKTKKDLRI